MKVNRLSYTFTKSWTVTLSGEEIKEGESLDYYENVCRGKSPSIDKSWRLEKIKIVTNQEYE